MIHTTVKIFKGSHITGKVNIADQSSVWFNAVIRGDIEEITIGKYSNIQDNCVLHSSKNHPLKIGSYVSIGHGAIVHGATIENNCLIGMNSTILNGAIIRKNSIVGAGAVVTEGKEFPEKSLLMGMPAKLIRKLENDEIEDIKNNSINYADMANKDEVI
ncbi:MAG: gamma carbonic anhydrase family protein [Methanobacterium sp.]|jgi:carbonic anhydrase/acetyltransferase-like protein (isoleucine patch superfamily)